MARDVYTIEITHDALAHIRTLPKKHHRLVFAVFRAELSLEPATQTRNRKLLTLPAPFDGHWELRFGPGNRLRAFYRIEGSTVLVVAVGIKQRARLRIGNEEVRAREGRIHRRGQGKVE